MRQYQLHEILGRLDPSLLDYSEWLSVGFALKEAGYPVSTWEAWSRGDTTGRFREGECARKWEGFRGSANPVTAGTVVQMAKAQGWSPEPDEGHELGWDDMIGGRDELVIINPAWVESREVQEPADWKPAEQLAKYLETLFEASENVGYVMKSWEKEGRFLPTQGLWDQTAGQIIEKLAKCRGDIGAVLGDWNEEAGAWIRFNPLDGSGCKDSNVTSLRYALVESDALEVEKQNAIIRELELPVACLVHSGNKSLHAIVRIDAANLDEYRKRVDYLYDVCKKNGLAIDNQNRNPSRLSRMPGATRAGQKQFLIETNIGKESWRDWQGWIESVNDDLPEPESMADAWGRLPELSPPLIDGVLRMGHKMLLAGPSKAGKSFALIEMCIAIAEGLEWLGWQCTQGRVLYVNLELDRASCLHRFRDVYEAIGHKPGHLANIDVWNLRGKSVPMDKLAPKLIRRALKKGYIAVVIDPIYKVITGDENSADQMAHFCNQFDHVCHELGAAVIYCHHHSKGQQGGKRSVDRASGSGVFARDPDAFLDLTELEVTEALLLQEENKAVCAVCASWLDRGAPGWKRDVPQDDQCSENAMLGACRRLLNHGTNLDMLKEVYAARKAAQQRTAWRIEGTMREFPKFEPVDAWFDYPIHKIDETGALGDLRMEGEPLPYTKATKGRKEQAEAERKKIDKDFNDLVREYKNFNFGEDPTVKQLAEYADAPERTLRDRMKRHGGYRIDRGKGNVIIPKDGDFNDGEEE